MRSTRTYSLNNDTGDLVRVSIAGWSAVLEVALAVLGDLAGDTDGAATVGDTVRELVDRAGLVAAGEALLIALTVDGNVVEVTGLELLHGGLDVLDATLSAHLLGGDVGVQTGAVPVAGDGLGSEGDLDTELFRDAVEDVTRHPELVAHCRRSVLRRHQVDKGTGDVLSMPSQGPTWYSHWEGMTSALIPETLMPAYRQAL